MDATTRLAIQAIVHGLHRGRTITTASVADIVFQLQQAAAARHQALDADGSRQLLALADAIEGDADIPLPQ